MKIKTLIWMAMVTLSLMLGAQLGGVAAKKKATRAKQLLPKVFAEWDIKKILSPQQILVIVAVNPDAAGKVKAVAMRVRPKDMALVDYRYFEEGVPRLFKYDREKEKFREVKLTPEQKKQCFACHRDGQYTGSVSAGDVG